MRAFVAYPILHALIILVFAGCSSEPSDSNKANYLQIADSNKLEGIWNPGVIFDDQENDIKQVHFIKFSENMLTYVTRCNRDNKVGLLVSGRSPYEIKNGTITIKNDIYVKVPYRITNNKVEKPSSLDDIKNFVIDDKTLFCECSLEAGDWSFEIKEHKGEQEFRNFQKNGHWPINDGVYEEDKIGQGFALNFWVPGKATVFQKSHLCY